MAKLYNLARVTCATTGTGTLTLGGAAPLFLTFAQAGVQNNDVVTYAIEDTSGREIGRGTYNSAGPTLARTSILRSTNNNAPLNLSGNAQVFITAAAEDFSISEADDIGVLGTAMWDVDYRDDGAGGLPTLQQWLDAHVNNRRFRIVPAGPISLWIDNTGAPARSTNVEIHNLWMPGLTLYIVTSAQFAGRLSINNVFGAIDIGPGSNWGGDGANFANSMLLQGIWETVTLTGAASVSQFSDVTIINCHDVRIDPGWDNQTKIRTGLTLLNSNVRLDGRGNTSHTYDLTDIEAGSQLDISDQLTTTRVTLGGGRRQGWIIDRRTGNPLDTFSRGGGGGGGPVTLDGDVIGSSTANTVMRMRNRQIAAMTTIPINAVLTWNGSQWEPRVWDVGPPAPVLPIITSSATAIGTVGSSFSHQIVATESPTSYAASPLPASVTINTTSGLISGTPSAAATTNVTVTATNAAGTSAPQTLVITIAAADQPPQIMSSATASGIVGSAFSHQIVATGNPTSYAASPLPAGVSINTTNGLISGTPSDPATTNVTVTATNAYGTSTPQTLVITIAAAPVVSEDDYSLTRRVTDMVWINGHPLHQVTQSLGTIPSTDYWTDNPEMRHTRIVARAVGSFRVAGNSYPVEHADPLWPNPGIQGSTLYFERNGSDWINWRIRGADGNQVYLTTWFTIQGVTSAPGPINFAFAETETPTNQNWINGRPIFQKTINLGQPPFAPIPHAIPTIGTMVEMFGFANTDQWNSDLFYNNVGGAGGSRSGYYVTRSHIQMQMGGGFGAYDTYYLTLKYTKTDVATPHPVPDLVFDTNERDTGLKWIDGKPVYQKTITATSFAPSTETSISHAISNMDTLVESYGVADNGTNYYPLPYCNDVSYDQLIGYRVTPSAIVILAGTTAVSSGDIHITLRYTKT